VEAGHGAGAYQEPTVAPAAPCLVHAPAELDVAKFPADGKNRTAAISAQGLPGCAVAGLLWSGGTGCATGQASRLTSASEAFVPDCS
jgi:hypothetical protein